jgi:phage regulator Rha-like protein
MSDLIPFEYNGQLVVDSRLIAQELGIEHDNYMQTINNYQTEVEKEFGVFLFETGKPVPVRSLIQRLFLLVGY